MPRRAVVELDMAAFDYSDDERIAGVARPSAHFASRPAHPASLSVR
jgi:hypothetical protein